MNKKSNYLNELKDIQNIANKIRSMRMNESMTFESEDEPFAQMDDIQMQAQEDEIPQGEECANGECDLANREKEDVKPEEQGMKELDQMGEVDQIRRITLDGMRKLADHPEHPQFQALLKIFQICNKAVETDKDNEQQNAQNL